MKIFICKINPDLLWLWVQGNRFFFKLELPGVTHEDEGHDGEEHKREEDEEGEVDGAADVVGERRRGLAQLLRVECTGASKGTKRLIEKRN